MSSLVTLWTLDGAQCVLCVDRAAQRYDLRIIDDGVVLLEELNIAVDDVMPTALTWQSQYASPAYVSPDAVDVRGSIRLISRAVFGSV
jgi:hypothetical protein